mmetsp:Transcript_15777/g.39710  ORF Transcript_15777/g.39710 Transcript_15777/m.39710 type:complete len:269 (-) Transcript_15777:483-1289(-)
MPSSHKVDVTPDLVVVAQIRQLVARAPKRKVPFGVGESVSDVVDRLADKCLVKVLERNGFACLVDETLKIPSNVETSASACFKNKDASTDALVAKLDNEPSPHGKKLSSNGLIRRKRYREDLTRSHDGNDGLDRILWVTGGCKSSHSHVRDTVNPNPPVGPRLTPNPTHSVVSVLPLILNREKVTATVKPPPSVLYHVIEPPLQVEHRHRVLPLAAIGGTDKNRRPGLLWAAWGGKSSVQLRVAVTHHDGNAPKDCLVVALHRREIVI